MVIKSQDVVSRLFQPVSSAPLAVFRILFGALMCFSTIRFMALGWIDEHYIRPLFHFRYFGFEWLPIGPDWFIYAVHVVMLISSIGILLGLYYRFSSVIFFLSFTYTELIDVSYYLNHYYFVSLISLLLIFIPAHCYFSVDVRRGKVEESLFVPRWTIFILKFQLFVVYFFAGIAKINSDWLIEALPLRIWLPAHDTMPILGSLFKLEETAYVFAWLGMVYDCLIVPFLMWRKTRVLAYISVVVFHSVTGALFQIGVFPIVMIASTLIFFDEKWHQGLISFFKKSPNSISNGSQSYTTSSSNKWVVTSLTFYALFQLLFPLRFLLYPGNLFWTEEGYRFSWRVMLVEKSGSATFYVKDAKSKKQGVVDNTEFLTLHQEKQMSFQPDMILQFAHFLADYYKQEGLTNPEVSVEVYVTMNARSSKLFVKSDKDLTKIEDSWAPKTWIEVN